MPPIVGASVGPMDRRMLMACYRFGFAVLTLVAIAAQLLDLQARGVLVPANFFSYFTIQSNLIAVAVFLIGAARLRTPTSAAWELVRGQAVIVMTITFVVFALLLSGTDVATAVPWVNTVVHEVMPIAVIVDWLIDPPLRRISFSKSLRWIVYPLIWTAYTLIRGAVVGWYPYPFVNPANGGYGTVALYVVAISVFGVILGALLAWVGNALGDRGRAAPESAISRP